MGEYKPVNINTYNTAVTQLSIDQKKWSKFSVPVIVKQFTEVNYVDANKGLPYLVAISSGLKVLIYNVRSGRPVSTITRFQRTAYGASYRDDGKLLVAGSEDATIRLFDCKNNDQLRVFKGHEGPIRRVKFMPDFPPRLVSFCDDKTVGIWDISDEKKIMQLNGHTDFVRSGCVNPSSPHLVISGSEDRTVKVWDVRTGEAVFNLDHGINHVNDVVCLHGGNILASAAGSEVRIWDLAAGKLLHKLCRHHKDVTSLALASDGTRLVSASLDQQLKIYDLSTYNLVHSVVYPASILNFTVMPDDSGVVLGMFSEGKGLISIQKKVMPKVKEPKKPPMNIEHLIKDSSAKIIKPVTGRRYPVADKLLLSFEYSKLLDLAMTKSKQPSEAVAYVAELQRRDGLRTAMSGRSQSSLNKIFQFIYKHFADSNYQSVLLDVIVIFLDLYSKEVVAGSRLEKIINKLQSIVTACLEDAKESIMLEGYLKLIQSVGEN